MSTKARFKKSSLLVSLLLFFLCAQQLSAANVLGRPRKMFLIKTEHFDIIYSNESQESALVLAENADRLYSEAELSLLEKSPGLLPQSSLHMPVIISPDSDLFSVTYTAFPYNRIIIFDSPAAYETSAFDDSLLSLFYREIYKALTQSIRSPFNQFLSKWLAGEAYQPVALFNLPYSFIEGNAYLEESSDSQGRLNDGYFLQILSQAKLEGKFPKWSQITSVRDIYPGEELSYAAAAGFAAFLMNTYGVEKYAALWEESGKINPLMTQGVFYKTYGIKLKELWAQFEDSVPLPAGLADIEGYEREGEAVFPKDKEANYEHLLLTDYGLVWYDRIRHEVDIYDEKNILKIRQLLFLADNVERMALSPDGRYIAVSHTQARTMEGLSSSSTWIYDLKERKFLDSKFQLRDSAIIKRADGAAAVAGVNVKNAHARLEVYSLPQGNSRDEKSTLIYSREFGRNETPFSPVYGGDGFVTYILNKGNESFLCRFSFEGNQEDSLQEEQWQIDTAGSEPLKIQRLAYNNTENSGEAKGLYTFSFTMPQEHSFTRPGFIQLNENYEPESIQLAAADVSGGMNYALLSPDKQKLFYSAKKYSVNQLRSVDVEVLPLAAGELRRLEGFEADGEAGTEPAAATAATLADYTVRRYNPFRYMTDLSFTPFFPIKQLDLSEGNFYWPGLGLTIESQTDPCMNTRALLSAGWNYLPLDFSWAKDIPSKYVAKFRTEALDISKDKSAAFYLENSSTPVYLQAGTIFKCNLKGEYDFKVLAGGTWNLPVGIALRHLIFDFQASYSASTDYYDQTQNEIRPSLQDWPSFNSAYEMYQLSLMMEYTNIHQYGYSTFEKRGLSLGIRIYSMWDMVEVRLLREARKEKEEKLQQEAQKTEGSSSEANTQNQLTNAQKKNLFSESLADITQLNAGVFATVAIPRLNPLPIINDWVLSMPAVVKAEFVNKAGTALEASFEALLIGREIHNNLIPAVLYSRRAGLWFGYDMALVYDTAETRLPDIRHENYLAEVFSGVSYTHAFYMILNLDLNITLGKLSTVPINTTLTGTFFPENHGYTISLDVRLKL